MDGIVNWPTRDSLQAHMDRQRELSLQSDLESILTNAGCVLLVALAVFGLIACCSPTAPTGGMAYGRVRIPITTEYRQWWAGIEACSGLPGDIDGTRFYVVDSLSGQAIGRTDGHDVYIVAGFTRNAFVVRHEMLHALGVHGHPKYYFDGVCGVLEEVE